MIYLVITPEKKFKTERLMSALYDGFCRLGEPSQIVTGAPPPNKEPFVVWGQEWAALRIIPQALQEKRPFWHIDNGFWDPARGGIMGYYRFCFRGMTPLMLPGLVTTRGDDVRLKPWRKTGNHVLLAMPGIHFGLSLGLNVKDWCDTIRERVMEATNRPVLLRPREASYPLSADMNNAWCLVTHSSNVAVDAAIAGVPVFVAPTSPAKYVGRTDLEFEQAVTPDRIPWIKSLACQQFTIEEMRSGEAQWHMRQVVVEYDRLRNDARTNKVTGQRVQREVD